jgi:hypothetical protein
LATLAFTFTGTTGADTLTGSGFDETFDGKGAPAGSHDTEVGGGGADTYLFNKAYGQLTIDNSGGASPHGQLDFGVGITEQNLWLMQSGNDLVIDRIGSTDSVTIQGWFSGDAGAPLAGIVASSDGMTIDTGVAQLVSAMAAFATANGGFNAATATNMPGNPSLQGAIAASWHH